MSILSQTPGASLVVDAEPGVALEVLERIVAGSSQPMQSCESQRDEYDEQPGNHGAGDQDLRDAHT